MAANNPNWQFETKAVHAGYEGDPTTRAVATPIYRPNTWESWEFQDFCRNQTDSSALLSGQADKKVPPASTATTEFQDLDFPRAETVRR